MRWFKIWEVSLIVIYMTCLLFVSNNMERYQSEYPDETVLYIIKLIASATLISIQTSPVIGSFKQEPVFYIVLWISLLSIVPDAIRCLLIFL